MPVCHEGIEGPAAVYLIYTWTSNTETSECQDSYAGLPIKSAAAITLGFTDLIPTQIRFNAISLYGNETSSALNEDIYYQEVNSLPPECPVEHNNLPLKDCTVKISIPKP